MSARGAWSRVSGGHSASICRTNSTWLGCGSRPNPMRERSSPRFGDVHTHVMSGARRVIPANVRRRSTDGDGDSIGEGDWRRGRFAQQLVWRLGLGPRLRWMLRKKLDQVPRGADERDRARFAKFASYMVLLDDKAMCKNMRCRKRFDISGVKTMAFI